MKINRTTLPNGLRLVHCQLATTRMVAINVLYRVGSANETPDRTGFAHLFEHLMFGGTVRYPDYDAVLQQAQGENNAYTTWDYTDYYVTLPARNLAIGLDVELDRMAGLAFTPQSLEVQRKVVMEEFKQTHLNQPYGDLQHLLARLSFGTPTGTPDDYRCEHPYSWPTIGLELQHIADATMPQVKDFFRRFYRPDNAILCVTGDMTWEEVLRGSLANLPDPTPGPPQGEGVVTAATPAVGKVYTPSPWGGPGEGSAPLPRRSTVYRPVPQPLLLMAFYLPPRSDADFPVCDMLSDLLANGKSSRFNQHLVEQRQLFLSLDAYVDGRLGTGQLMIEGIPADGVPMAEAEAAVWEELQAVQRELVGDEELQKLKNRFETTFELQISDYQRLAEQLAYYEMLGDAHRLFDEVPSYQAIDSERLRTVARRILDPANACVLHYLCSADS